MRPHGDCPQALAKCKPGDDRPCAHPICPHGVRAEMLTVAAPLGREARDDKRFIRLKYDSGDFGWWPVGSNLPNEFGGTIGTEKAAYPAIRAGGPATQKGRP